MFFRGVKIPKIESKPDPSRHRPGASGGYPVPVGPKGGLKSGYVASRMPSRRDPVTQPLRREPRPFRSTSHSLSSEKCHGLRSSAPAGIHPIPFTKIPDRKCAATRFPVRDSLFPKIVVSKVAGAVSESRQAPSEARSGQSPRTVGSQAGTATRSRLGATKTVGSRRSRRATGSRDSRSRPTPARTSPVRRTPAAES